MVVQKSMAAAMGTFHRFKNNSKKDSQTRLGHLLFQLSSAIGAGSSETLPGLPPPLPQQLFHSLSFLLLAALLSAAPHALVPRSQPPSYKNPATTTSRLGISGGRSWASSKTEAKRPRARKRTRRFFVKSTERGVRRLHRLKTFCRPPPLPKQTFSTSTVCASSWKQCVAEFLNSNFGR